MRESEQLQLALGRAPQRATLEQALAQVQMLLRNNSPYYRKSLQEGLKTLFPLGVEDPGYFFFGYYMKKENIHLQPLSNMVQDVVEAMTAARA